MGFVKIKFNGQEFKSQKVRNSLNPEWNFSTNLTVKSSDVDSDIVLEVYDDDFGSENFIGSYTISLQQAITDTDKEATWHNLVGCITGKISFSTIYIPDEEPETKSKEDKIKVDDNLSSINEDKSDDKSNNKSDENSTGNEEEQKSKTVKDSSENNESPSQKEEIVNKETEVTESTDKKEEGTDIQMTAESKEMDQKEQSMNGHTEDTSSSAKDEENLPSEKIQEVTDPSEESES